METQCQIPNLWKEQDKIASASTIATDSNDHNWMNKSSSESVHFMILRMVILSTHVKPFRISELEF